MPSEQIERSWTIGSGHDCDVVIDDATVSRQHCRVLQTGSGFILEDLSSTNGTYLNGTKVTTRVQVTAQDRIVLAAGVELPWESVTNSGASVATIRERRRATAVQTGRPPIPPTARRREQGFRYWHLVIGAVMVLGFFAAVTFLTLSPIEGEQHSESAEQFGVFEGADDPIRAVALSPDGQRAASAGDDATVRLWDVRTRQLTNELRGHRLPVTSLSFSVDSKRLASGSEDRTVRVWDLETSKDPLVISEHEDSVTAVAFYPSGGFVVSGGGDKKVIVSDATSGETIRRLNCNAPVDALAVAADGKELVVGEHDGRLGLWSLSDRRFLREFSGPNASVSAVALSPDGKWLAASHRGSGARLWEVEVGGRGRSLEVPELSDPEFVSLSFSTGSTRLAGAGTDRWIYLWYCAEANLLKRYEGHDGDLSSVAYSPNSLFILSGSVDATMRLWIVPKPTPREADQAERAAQALQRKLSNLTQCKEHLDAGEQAADDRDFKRALAEFRSAKGLVDADSLEYSLVESAIADAETGQKFASHMRQGKEALDVGELGRAADSFKAAERVLPDNTEARDARKQVEGTMAAEAAMKDATVTPVLRFDFGVPKRDRLKKGKDFVAILASDQKAGAKETPPAGQSKEPPLGLANVPLLWEFQVDTMEPFPSTEIRCKIQLTKLGSTEVIGASESPLIARRTRQSLVGTAQPPPGGWSHGRYEFRIFLLVGERQREWGDPRQFEMIAVNWETKAITLSPELVQKSVYTVDTGITVAPGDGMAVRADGEIRLAPATFFVDLFNDKRARRVVAAPPEGLRQVLGPRLETYWFVANELPFGAVLYRYDGRETWIPCLADKKPMFIADRVGPIELAINSVVARRSGGKFQPIPKDDDTYWSRSGGAFDVSVYRARFQGSGLNDDARLGLMTLFLDW